MAAGTQAANGKTFMRGSVPRNATGASRKLLAFGPDGRAQTPDCVASSYPYTAVGQLTFTNPTGTSGYICSGSLVASNTVLTAG